MYPKNNLYKIYKKNIFDSWLSPRLPDDSREHTLNIINNAINCCEDWDNFIDIGAGSGNYSAPLLEKFKQGVLVEPLNNLALNSILEKYNNARVINDYIEKVNFEEKFDFVLLADLFEHIPKDEIKNFMKQISNIQEKGGVIFVLTPNPIFCGPAKKSALYFKIHKDGHHKHYLKYELIEMFNDFGYRPIFYEYEENKFRRILKRYFYRISRFDHELIKKSIIYKYGSFPVIIFIKFFFKPLFILAIKNEEKNNNDKFNSMSLGITFKKII